MSCWTQAQLPRLRGRLAAKELQAQLTRLRGRRAAEARPPVGRPCEDDHGHAPWALREEDLRRQMGPEQWPLEPPATPEPQGPQGGGKPRSAIPHQENGEGRHT